MTWMTENRFPTIAVLSDRCAARAAGALAVDMCGLGGFDAEAVVGSDVGDGLAALVDNLPERFRAVMLVQIDPGVAHEASERALERGLRLVVSDHDGAAAAMCAAVLNRLRAVGRPADVAQVVIAGGDNLPSLAPLLMIAGVYDLLMWQDADAAVFPWPQIARTADVVIDLRPGPAATAETSRITRDRPEGSVLRPADAEWDLHVVAAVLRVALACPPGSMHVELSMLRACAMAIAAATPPPGHARITDSAVIDIVEAAVRRSIDPRLAALGATERMEES